MVIDVTLQQIQSICGADDVGRVGGGGDSVPSIMGCATFQGGKCIVHVPGDLKTVLPDVYDVVLRHELGHCRGWGPSQLRQPALKRGRPEADPIAGAS